MMCVMMGDGVRHAQAAPLELIVQTAASDAGTISCRFPRHLPHFTVSCAYDGRTCSSDYAAGLSHGLARQEVLALSHA